MTATSWGDTHTDTAQRIVANIHVGLDLLTMGTAHGLRAPFRVEGTDYRTTLQCDNHKDVQRWASYVGIAVAYERHDSRLIARARGRWHDRPVELCSSTSIAFLSGTTCPSCEGSGEVGTGLREHDTGAHETTGCGLCDATGTLAMRT